MTHPNVDLCEVESSRYHREFYEKEAGTSLIFVNESYLTCLLWALILGNAGFYAGPTDNALEEAKSSGERGLRGET